MKFLILALVCLSGIVSANEEDLLKAFIPEDIIHMVIELINSIDFSKVILVSNFRSNNALCHYDQSHSTSLIKDHHLEMVNLSSRVAILKLLVR